MSRVLLFLFWGLCLAGNVVAAEVRILTTSDKDAYLFWEPFAVRLDIEIPSECRGITLAPVINGKEYKPSPFVPELWAFNKENMRPQEGKHSFFVTLFAGVSPDPANKFPAAAGEYTVAFVDKNSGARSNTVTVHVIDDPHAQVLKEALSRFANVEVLMFLLHDKDDDKRSLKSKAQEVVDVDANTVYAKYCRHAIAVCEKSAIEKERKETVEDFASRQERIGALAERFGENLDPGSNTIFVQEAMFYRAYCLAIRKEYNTAKETLSQFLARFGESPTKYVDKSKSLLAELDKLLPQNGGSD